MIRAGLAVKHLPERLLILLVTLVFVSAPSLASSADWWVDITNNRVHNVQRMLSAGVDPNEKSKEGQPAIMQAVRDGAWDVFDVLACDTRTDLNALNINNETPLMYVAVAGETSRAQGLIQRGAQVNRLGWSPLHYAASKGHADTTRLLIQNKAIINAPAPDGTTPLMMAAFSGDVDTVQALLHAGADVTTLNLDKHDAADWARLRKHTSLANKLDDLTRRVLAQREAFRTGKGPEVGSGAASMDLNTAATAAKPVPEKSTDDRTSTSRYFDLERFDEDPTP